MAAFIGLVEVDEVVIRLLCRAGRGLVVLAGKGAHGRRGKDVGGVVEAERIFPVQAGRRNRRVGQPVEGDGVQKIVSGEVTCQVSVADVPEHGRRDRRRWLAPAVPVVQQPGGQADG